MVGDIKVKIRWNERFHLMYSSIDIPVSLVFMAELKASKIIVIKIIYDSSKLREVINYDEVVMTFEDGELVERFNRVSAFKVGFDSTLEKVEGKAKQVYRNISKST